MHIPRLAITMGDPAGIGPEIVAKVLSLKAAYELCRPVVIGDRRLLSVFSSKLKNYPCEFINIPIADIRSLRSGVISVSTGTASYRAVKCAVELAMENKVDGIVTAPISKAALNMAGVRYPGHTELLAHLSGSRGYAMLMVAGKLRTVMVTRHLPLVKTGRCITTNEIIRTTLLARDFVIKRYRIPKPRIVVCSLNPHAGEGGLLGKEEGAAIIPAVKKLCDKGVLAEGPLPADSAWIKLKKGLFDLMVTMYHDQAMIGLKCLAPDKIVNITAGLPFVRTSPGHGTGFDIAGKNCANPASMMEALKVAAQLCKKDPSTSSFDRLRASLRMTRYSGSV